MALKTLMPAMKPKEAKAPAAPKPPKTPKAPKAVKGPKAPKNQAFKEVTWPENTKPTLVFLPDKIRGARDRRRAVRRSTGLAVILLGAMGVAYVSVAAATAATQAELDLQNQLKDQHISYLNEHAAVQEYYDGFITQKQGVFQALESDVSYSKVLDAVYEANDIDAVFTSITKVKDVADCPADNPFGPSTAIGCLEIAGEAPAVGDVGHLVAELSGSGKLLVDPYATESTNDGETTSFRLKVGYTEEALSFKGADFKPTDDELTSIAPAPATPATQEVTQ